ncbi:WD repeat-containing protein 55 homolog [Anopheles moucheti]|uniref:WD repeat-containing protein 55 homolog n=1 Tax=Anopheles moucheti TaxID=186751 RepID=UPI0022F0EE58|nr:WD repeat-containing protein 55 homolog [Anopheles moucheti]XP_052894659.1 WD repeat-containing protein 55 homolog [Anopheles moucheti]
MRNFHSPYFRDSSDSEDDAEIDIDQLGITHFLTARTEELLEYDVNSSDEAEGALISSPRLSVMDDTDSDDTYEEGDDSLMSDSSEGSDMEDQATRTPNGNKANPTKRTSNGEGASGSDSGSDVEEQATDAACSNKDEATKKAPDGECTSASGPSHRVIDDYDEELEDDDVIKAIISEIKKPRSKPPDIQTEDFVVDLSFHPSKDILAVGTSVGDVLMYKYSNEQNVLAATHELHTKAVRCVEFTRDGKSIISTGRERSIVVADMETGKFKRFWEAAHDEPVYSMAILGENLFATGDDDGTVKLWDLRQKDAVFSLRPVEDFISSILANGVQQKFLLMTSGDGLLTTINIAQRKMYVQSEPYEEELNCLGTFKRESKLVVGTSKGNYYTFNWGQFAYHCDAFTGPKASANRMVPITEQIAVMAGEDGIIRAMHLVPGRVLGIVGQHAMAIDTLDISGSGELIATSSHDNDVRFWNIKYFEDFDGIKYNSKPDQRTLKHNLPSSQRINATDFFAGLND